MARNIRIGNDIQIRWTILRNGSPESLEGKELTLILYNQVRKYLVKDFTIEGNTILFTYYGKDQCDLGVYGVTLYENKCKENMFTVDFDEAFKLVSNSSEVTYTEPDYGDLQVIVLEGTSDIMVPDYSNVVKISDVSDDPIENDHGKVASTVATFKLNSLIEEESDRAKSQEDILQQSIEAEKTRAEEVEKQLQQNIDAEKERAINAESGIQQEIEAEITRATKAETTLAGAIVQESDRAKGEEGKLNNLILEESNRAKEEEGILQQNIDNEISRATDRESDLENKINQEVSRATDRENILQQSIETEVSRAELAEELLQQSIDNLNSNKANKSTTLQGYGITDAYTKSEVDEKLSKVYKYKGSVPTYDDLPTENLSGGDTYNVESDGQNYAWDEELNKWDSLGSIYDFTLLLSKEEAEQIYATKDELQEESSRAKEEEGKLSTQVNSKVTSQGGETGETVTTFDEADIRSNIISGEKHSTLFGKIKKWLTDLKSIAFSGSYNDLSDTPTSLPPSGVAGGDLTGSYPNPTIGQGKITVDKIADGVIPTELPAKGGSAESATKDGDGRIITETYEEKFPTIYFTKEDNSQAIHNISVIDSVEVTNTLIVNYITGNVTYKAILFKQNNFSYITYIRSSLYWIAGFNNLSGRYVSSLVDNIDISRCALYLGKQNLLTETEQKNVEQAIGLGKRYLSKTNTIEYTPTEDYHPSTKKYVDDVQWSDINLIPESNVIIIEAGTSTNKVKTIRLPNVVNAGEQYSISIGGIQDISGSPTGYTVGLFSPDGSIRLANTLTLTKENRSGVFTISSSISDQEASLFLYAGISMQTVGNTVEYENVMLTRGNKPSLSWAPSPNDIATKEYVNNLYWYGIEWDVTNSSPLCTRIGNMDLHRSLPIQSRMRGCLLDDDGNVVKYLNPTDWTSETRDGSAGQVMVEIPEHYIKFETEGNINRVKISEVSLPSYIHVPKMYISAYEASVQRSTSKLSSVVNTTTDYRGGNNNSSWDGTYRSLLGMPVTNINRISFRKYARNRKIGSAEWNLLDYNAYKAVFWLYYVEYANRNCQSSFNAEKDANGFAQGGLGAGVTNVNSTKWSAYNSYYPFIPCGYTDELGNGTGEVEFTMPQEYDTETLVVKVPRYRGIENPFGHLWKWTDGINIQIASADDGGTSKVWVSSDPSKYNDSNYDGYEIQGEEARTEGYTKTLVFGENGDIIPAAVGGGSTTYWADYHSTNIPASGVVLRGVLFGGSANHRLYAGFAYAYSNDAPSSTNALFGSRLCFIPNKEGCNDFVNIPVGVLNLTSSSSSSEISAAVGGELGFMKIFNAIQSGQNVKIAGKGSDGMSYVQYPIYSYAMKEGDNYGIVMVTIKTGSGTSTYPNLRLLVIAYDPTSDTFSSPLNVGSTIKWDMN